jgi:hypothetical protein
MQPVAALDCYLHYVYDEAVRRGYRFDISKLGPKQECSKMPVTEGQIRYELNHLKAKLKVRNLSRYQTICAVKEPGTHPLFRVVEGGIESWEKR